MPGYGRPPIDNNKRLSPLSIKKVINKQMEKWTEWSILSMKKLTKLK